jgi:AcrR family transcriptional regulator
VTVRSLAKRLDVSPAAYAYHFPDKATLLLAIATEGFRRLNAAFEPALRINDPYQRFYKLGQCYLDFALGNPAHYKVMFSDHSGLGHDAAYDDEFIEVSTEAFQALHKTVERLLSSAQSDRNSLDVSMVIWSQIHGAVSLWQEGMFAPAVAEGESGRTEEQFRDLMRKAAEDTASYLTGKRIRAEV